VNLDFLIDECLHRRLVDLAAARGHLAEHVVRLGLAGTPDGLIAGAAVGRGAVLVTNNRRDFRRIYARLPRHPGLAVIVPNGPLALQARLFEGLMIHLEDHAPADCLVEIDAAGAVTLEPWSAARSD